ncbi:uncharacterized protein LOC103578365 [Microplitis demolitor]|uniref:uncharacterized protein LOC103578365 n=1 Tax=Microplitis demolitor TaxID=69319 RepID=UPI0004CD7707|nr:uncharacterized protein LOC103578365 [Microplitis demolitor]
MANSGNSSAESALTKLGLQPVTKCSLAKFYVPAFGVTAYTGLCLNVMNPNLITRIFPKTDVTNFFLGTSLVGAGSYIYTREHMKAAAKSARIIYSVAGAVLLNFGSVLLWAVVRSIVPPNPAACTIAGIGAGVAVIKAGHSYLEFVDSQVAKK